MTIETLKNGLVKLTPDEGNILVDTRNNYQCSEATVRTKDVKYFKEIEINE